MPDVTVDTLFSALEEAGSVQYGTEAISELEHALQIAELAERMSGDPEMICGALLHDIGRVAVRQDEISDTLVPDHMGNVPSGGRGHDVAGAELLEGYFPERVLAGYPPARRRQALSLHGRAGLPRCDFRRLRAHAGPARRLDERCRAGRIPGNAVE